MYALACSCRVCTSATSSRSSWSASNAQSSCTPGSPNSVRMPSCRSACASACPPVISATVLPPERLGPALYTAGLGLDPPAGALAGRAAASLGELEADVARGEASHELAELGTADDPEGA